jgi:hypothetical protein
MHKTTLAIVLLLLAGSAHAETLALRHAPDAKVVWPALRHAPDAPNVLPPEVRSKTIRVWRTVPVKVGDRPTYPQGQWMPIGTFRDGRTGQSYFIEPMKVKTVPIPPRYWMKKEE